jgi:hypothetical protein
MSIIGTNKEQNMKQTLNKPKKNVDVEKEDDDVIEFPMDTITTFLLPFAILASIIAWFRNKDSYLIIRIVYVVIAYLTNIVYLFYIAWKWWTQKKE